MDLSQSVQELQRLRYLLDTGQTSPEAYVQAVNSLQITDAYGNFWHVDGSTQRWYRYDGQGWVEQASPLQQVEPQVAPPPPTAADWASGQPQPGYPPRARSKIGLWIGLGAVGLVIVAAAILLLTGTIKLGGGTATVTPTLTSTLAAVKITSGPSVTPQTSKTATTIQAASSTPTISASSTPTKSVSSTPTKLTPTVSATVTHTRSATPTVTLPAPSDFLRQGNPFLLSMDQGAINLIQDKRTDGLNSDAMVAPGTLTAAAAPAGGHAAFVTSPDVQGIHGLKLIIYDLNGNKVEKTIALTSAKTEPPANAGPGDPSFEAARSITDVGSSLQWSPDGRTLAFIAFIDGPSSDLYSYNLDTGKILHLTDGPSQAFSPNWSPDGKYIVQFGATAFGTGAGYSMAGVWAARADDSAVITLYTPTSSGEHLLGWLDANTFLVYGFNAICGYRDLRKVTIQPVKVTSVFAGCFDNASFDPASGAAILAISQGTASFCSCSPTQSGLYLYAWDGSKKQLSTASFYDGAVIKNTTIVWGLTEKQEAVAFTTGGTAVKLPAGVPAVLPLAAPGGKWWAWLGDSSNPGLWLGSPDTGAQKVFNGTVSSASWLPDGSALAFLSETDLYFVLAAPGAKPTAPMSTFGAFDLKWVSR